MAYADVLSEAVNNPLRLLAGWYLAAPGLTPPPLSLLLSYWLIGCCFMAMKRFSEYRDFRYRKLAILYRRFFRHYTQVRLLVSVMFYGSAAMLFFGAFAIRYRMELVLSFPLVALVMAIYLRLAFRRHGAVQAPEKLHRERGLMLAVLACSAAMVLLLFVDLPAMYRLFSPKGLTPQD